MLLEYCHVFSFFFQREIDNPLICVENFVESDRIALAFYFYFPSIILKIDVRKYLNSPIAYKKTKFFSLFFSFVSNIKMLSSVVHEDMKAVRTLEKYKTRVKWLLKVVKQLLLLHNLYKGTKEGILLCILVYSYLSANILNFRSLVSVHASM